jgi:hypothetical protein
MIFLGVMDLRRSDHLGRDRAALVATWLLVSGLASSELWTVAEHGWQTDAEGCQKSIGLRGGLSG